VAISEDQGSGQLSQERTSLVRVVRLRQGLLESFDGSQWDTGQALPVSGKKL